jgi:hypothetical protein
MKLVNKLEKLILGWAKNMPHLPQSARKWLGVNVWWIALVGVIISTISLLLAVGALMNLLTVLTAVSSVYYVTGLYSGIDILQSGVSIALSVVSVVVLALAVKPLQTRQKKGWDLLFIGLLISAVSIVVNAVLTFSVFGFVGGILFGAIALAIGAYFITEIHGQFAQKSKTTAKKA